MISVPRILYRVPSEASLGLTIGVPVYLGSLKGRKTLCPSYSRAGAGSGAMWTGPRQSCLRDAHKLFPIL